MATPPEPTTAVRRGPRGGFEALISRFGGAVHVLTENVRQIDPVERAAVGHLRSGDVDAAVAWYALNGRIAVSPDRDTAMDATVAASLFADSAQARDSSGTPIRRTRTCHPSAG